LLRQAFDDLVDIINPCIFGHQFVYTLSGLLKMFRYSNDEVIVKHGNIFQGPKTDGTLFWMLFHMCPVYSSEEGNVLNFQGVQEPILGKLRQSGSVVVRNASIFLKMQINSPKLCLVVARQRCFLI
jgi:hypothetical protein